MGEALSENALDLLRLIYIRINESKCRGQMVSSSEAKASKASDISDIRKSLERPKSKGARAGAARV